MNAEMMPEPPNRALVGLFDPTGERVPLVFERDDTEDAERTDRDHWFSVNDAEAYTWPEVLRAAELGDEVRRQVVRLYRADDPAITVNGRPNTATVSIKRPDDDHLEVHVNGRVVATADHDEHGWSGMDAVEKTAVAVARAFGGTVND